MSSPNDFWAITTYFNLTNGKRRLQNYHCFRHRLSVPLLTVEWHPDRRFQLKSGDADMLLQVGGGDLMWQKERLLTLAVSALPDTVKYIAWIDCDILFDNPNWVDEARGLLDCNSVVQLYSEFAYAGENETLRLIESRDLTLDIADIERLRKHESFLSLYGRVKDDIVRLDLDRRFQSGLDSSFPIHRPVFGFAWAARASFLRNIGYYQRCIMGAGDLLFCYGISGLSQKLLDNQKTVGWEFYGDCPSYRLWAGAAAAACNGGLGCVNGRILHLFHGSLANRQYTSRINGLIPFALDLDRDIVTQDGQPWSWRRDRDQLNEYFLKYLRDRNEDGEAAPRDAATG